jgi:hypothetical protein
MDRQADRQSILEYFILSISVPNLKAFAHTDRQIMLAVYRIDKNVMEGHDDKHLVYTIKLVSSSLNKLECLPLGKN